MKSTAQASAISGQSENQDKRSIALMAKAAAIGILSFFFGSAALFGTITPFATAFIVCLPLPYLISAGIGSILSILLFTAPSSAFWQILAILLAVGGKFVLDRLITQNGQRIKPALSGIIAFFAMFVSTVIRGLATSLSMPDFVFLTIQVLLCGCFGYFFSIGADALLRPRTSPILSYVQITSLGIIFIGAISGATAFSIFNINIGVILGVLSIYLFMNRFGIIGASISSIVVAIALNLASADMLSFAAMLVMASFIAGAFSPLGKLGQVSSFILVSVFSLLLLGAPIGLTYRIIDIFMATALYVLLPKRIIALIELRPADANASIHAGTMQGNVAARLSFASDTIRSLKDELKTVSSKFSEIDYNNIGALYDMAANTVCKSCSRALDCWDKSYSDTVDAFNPITARLKAVGSIDENSIPAYFTDKCCKLTRFIETINNYYSSFLDGQTAKRQIADSRRIVFEQFSSMADMLCEMSAEIGSIGGYDEAAARRAQAAFTKLEGEPLQVIAMIDSFGRLTIEIYTDNVIKTSKNVLCQAISNAADAIFELPDIESVSGKTKLSFFEKAGYSLDFSIQQLCCGNNTVCGDSTENFIDNKGFSYFLLSDGMGNGGRAAIDSVMTCSIMSKLLRAGFGVTSAIKLINSSLAVKSTDESLSTIDLAKIDLYTGKAELFKAGAATTFIQQSGEISRFSSAALPIGILQTAECEKRLVTLREGDCLLMVSDGATQNGEGFIADDLKRMSTQNRTAHDIAAAICQDIKGHASSPQDDVTVMAIRMIKGI